jgi:hypothetical protein
MPLYFSDSIIRVLCDGFLTDEAGWYEKYGKIPIKNHFFAKKRKILPRKRVARPRHTENRRLCREKEFPMPKKLIASESCLSEIYPDPLGRAKGSAITNPLTEIALAGDMPASRLFANLPAALERDIRAEAKREWEEEHRPSTKG